MGTTDVVGVKFEADLKKLQDAYHELLANGIKLQNQVDKIGDEYTQTGNQGAAAMNKVDAATKSVSKSTGAMTSVLNNAGAALLTAFSIQAVVQIGKQIVEVTGKFQRYAAVLENTLGSKSEAQKALMMIQKFAAETPFSVDQLTDSYIRLTNSGFQPTQEELRKLGDLAASQGKQFDQLAEAIIDAQTGEFERLKEFGIRASKEGDNVKFSFKGVETQTKFTSAAIQDYILSLGDLQGVAGGMNAISTTLEGRISNLGDSWGQFLNNLGSQTSGVFFEVIEGFSNLLTALNAMLETEEQKMLKLQNEAKEAAFQQSQNWSDKELQLVIDSLASQRAVVMADYKQAEKDGFEFKQKELIAQFNHLANQEQGLKDVLADRQKGRLEDQKNAEKDAERQKKEDEKRAKEAEKFRQELLKMQFDTQALRIELMDEGIGKELAKQQLGYLKEREQYRNNKEALLLIDEKYLKERQEIIQKFEVQQIDVTKDVGKELKTEREKEVKDQFALALEGIKNWETLNEAKKERDKKNDEEELESAQQLADAKRELLTAAMSATFEVADARRSAEFNKELSDLADRREAELANKDLTESEKLAIEEKYAAQEAALKAEQFRKQRNADVIQALINTALAVSRALATPPAPNLIAAGLAAGLGGIQIGAILATPVPQFKDGVLDIQGPGTETSDSIAARLSKGESVMTANQTKAWKSELKAMRAGNFEDVVFAKYVLPALQEDRRQRDTASNMAQSLSLQNLFDDKRIVAELKANKPASSKDIQRLDKTIQRTFKDSAYVRSKMWKN